MWDCIRLCKYGIMVWFEVILNEVIMDKVEDGGFEILFCELWIVSFVLLILFFCIFLVFGGFCDLLW